MEQRRTLPHLWLQIPGCKYPEQFARIHATELKQDREAAYLVGRTPWTAWSAPSRDTIVRKPEGEPDDIAEGS